MSDELMKHVLALETEMAQWRKAEFLLPGALTLPAKPAHSALMGPVSGADAIPDFRIPAQADITGLHTTDSPVFVTAKLSGLSDGLIPYHVSDAVGLADGPTKADVDSAVSLKHASVTLANPNHGLGLTGQELTLGTPSTLTAATTNAVTTTTHTHAITGFAVPGDLHAAVTLGNYASRIVTLTGQTLTTPTVAAHKAYLGPISGADAAPDWRVFDVTDLPAHSILSASHSDTLADTILDGDMLSGNVTPKLARVPISIPGAGILNYWGVNNGELRGSWKSASSNPSAAAAILATDASGYLTLVKLNTDTITDKSGANLTISPTSDVILDPVGNDVLPGVTYDINLGGLTKKYLTIHAAELWVETLVAQDTLATIGGRVLIGPTTQLTAALGSAAGDTTITVKHNQIANGDRIYLEVNGKVEFMAVTSAAGGGAGAYTYTVTRDLDATGRNAWDIGDAVFNTGTTGDGFIDLYSVRSIKSATQYGPAIVGNVRNSATYNDWSEAWAIGNLNGVYGYGADNYGVGLGKYIAAEAHVTVDSTNGLRIFTGLATVVGQWAANGTITVGEVGASKNNILISAGALSLRNNVTEMIGLTAAGIITIGEVGASKNNILISSGAISIRNNITERIGLTAAGILTIKDSAGEAVITLDAASGAEITKILSMGAAGKITVDTDAVVIDANGITLRATNTYDSLSCIKWLNSSAIVTQQIYGTFGTSGFQLSLISDGTSIVSATRVNISAISKSPAEATSSLIARTGTTYITAYLTEYATDLPDTGFFIDNDAAGNIFKVLYNGDITATGNLTMAAGTDIIKGATTGYLYVPLTTPATNASWNLTAYSTQTVSTQIDTSVAFGLPVGVKMILAEIVIRDSAAYPTGGLYFCCGPSATCYYAYRAGCWGADYLYDYLAPVPCDANGDVWYRITASGASTMDIMIRIWGYWI